MESRAQAFKGTAIAVTMVYVIPAQTECLGSPYSSQTNGSDHLSNAQRPLFEAIRRNGRREALTVLPEVPPSYRSQTRTLHLAHSKLSCTVYTMSTNAELSQPGEAKTYAFQVCYLYSIDWPLYLI